MQLVKLEESDPIWFHVISQLIKLLFPHNYYKHMKIILLKEELHINIQ
jgi:hypothetical protein